MFVNSMSDLFHDDVPDEFIAWMMGAGVITSVLIWRLVAVSGYVFEVGGNHDA